jgi:hypothetical protein
LTDLLDLGLGNSGRLEHPLEWRLHGGKVLGCRFREEERSGVLGEDPSKQFGDLFAALLVLPDSPKRLLSAET